VVVGRESPADVALGIGTVSGQHAKFEAGEDGEVYVTDMGSSNGTEVDGRPVPRGQMFKLSVGDVVTLGDPHLARYEVVEAVGDTLADRFAGIQETAAEAEKNARAVGEAINKGATTVKNARAAIAGVGDVFKGFGGKNEKRDEEVVGEVLATFDVDDQYDADRDDTVEVIQPTYLSTDEDLRWKRRSRHRRPSCLSRRSLRRRSGSCSRRWDGPGPPSSSSPGSPSNWEPVVRRGTRMLS
jgi:hypothetical protein